MHVELAYERFDYAETGLVMTQLTIAQDLKFVKVDFDIERSNFTVIIKKHALAEIEFAEFAEEIKYVSEKIIEFSKLLLDNKDNFGILFL